MIWDDRWIFTLKMINWSNLLISFNTIFILGPWSQYSIPWTAPYHHCSIYSTVLIDISFLVNPNQLLHSDKFRHVPNQMAHLSCWLTQKPAQVFQRLDLLDLKQNLQKQCVHFKRLLSKGITLVQTLHWSDPTGYYVTGFSTKCKLHDSTVTCFLLCYITVYQ